MTPTCSVCRFRTLSARLRAGFSMIEILVAMTILTVIVLIVAEIFQQTGLAWSLGLRRADEQSMTRAIIGTLTRDLSMMVDPANFVIHPSPDAESDQLDALNFFDMGEGEIGSSLVFWALKPSDPTASEPASRELTRVKYSGGKREETRYGTDGFTLGETTTTDFDLGGGSISFKALRTDEERTFTSLYDASGLVITVQPTTPTSINDYEIAVASCGPDGEWGTEDDIRPWVEGEDSN